MSTFIQISHPLHIPPPQGEHPSGHCHNTFRGGDAPCPPAALLHQLFGVHLRLVHFRLGKGPTHTLNTDGPLDDFQPWAGIHKPPHQAEVAVGKGVARPHSDYKAPHGLFGHLVKFDHLLQLAAQGHGVFGPSILRPEQLLC